MLIFLFDPCQIEYLSRGWHLLHFCRTSSCFDSWSIVYVFSFRMVHFDGEICKRKVDFLVNTFMWYMWNMMNEWHKQKIVILCFMKILLWCNRQMYCSNDKALSEIRGYYELMKYLKNNKTPTSQITLPLGTAKYWNHFPHISLKITPHLALKPPERCLFWQTL